MTKTQTFSKEERGAVHLLYDPDFRDKNDFRQDLRKVSQSPGPGAHRDPLTSYKYVITQNGNFSIPKVNLFVNKILIAIAGRAAEEMVSGTAECTVGAQQDISQMTRILRTMVVRYALARLQELKQQAQQRNLFFLGSDVKQELNNIIDNFTTNFMDITYNEVISFLETIRPGGERLVDQLMISEELTGKDLRTIAREYISNLSSSEVLYNTRKSSLFDLLLPELKKSVKDIENNIDSLVLDTDITKYEENSLKSSF